MKAVKAKRGSKTEKAIQLNDGTLVFDKYRDVEDILYNAYSEKFQTGETTDNTWLAKFVNENLDKIKKGITMDPTTAPTALREVNKIATKTAEYVRSKQTFDTDLSRYLLQKQLFPWQKKVFEDTSKKKSLLAGRRCWAPDTEILMYSGKTKKVKDIQVGDLVMGADNLPHEVIELHKGTDSMYRVHDQKNQIDFKCNSQHIITAKVTRENQYWEVGTIIDISVEDYLSMPIRQKRNLSLWHQAIEYKEQKHSIDPYWLGLWLGDGTSSNAHITINNEETEILNKVKPDYYKGMSANFYGMVNKLRDLNLLNNKHIPEEYMIDSKYNRLQLLGGLIDSDGYKPKDRNLIEFCNCNKKLFDDVVLLCKSLGFHTNVRSKMAKLYGKPCKTVYTLTIKGNLSEIGSIVERKKCSDCKQSPVYNFTVDYIGKGDYIGFTVSGDPHILLGDYTINHNSGKSFLINYLAISHCLEKSAKQRQAAIVGLTLERTASIYWDSLKEAVAKCHIEHKVDNAKYRITFSNGNFIELFGNGSKAEREKFRGFDLSFAAIDEMQSQQGLMYLIIDVIGPMLKGQDGDLVCAGTAPLSAGTYWEQIINDNIYTSFHATMEDNPTIPDHENALQTILEENHWTKDNITYRREYLGEVAYDTNRMIYPKRTYYKELPKEQFIACYIGIDYGWADYSSFAPILITNNKTGYLINEWKENKTASSAIVNKMKALVESIHTTYNIPNENIKLVADSSHQQISFDIYNQGVINIENAYKLGENYQIARVAEALEIGNLLIKEGDYFDQECNSMVWKWNDENGTVIYEIDDKTFHPDIADSVKYAWNTYLSENLY